MNRPIRGHVPPGTTMREWEKRRAAESTSASTETGDQVVVRPASETLPALSETEVAVLRAALLVIERLVGR